jgi:hypothetical protein
VLTGRLHVLVAFDWGVSKLGGSKVRKVTFGGANSLDNYLARPDHAVDWLMWGDEAAAVMANYWKTIDTILMGRKTYAGI